MKIRCAIPGDGYQQVSFWINKINRIWLCISVGMRSCQEREVFHWPYCPQQDSGTVCWATKSLVTQSDRWRMPSFLEVGLVHMTASTWIFWGVSLTVRTLKLVLAGAYWISSSGCGIKQIGSQHSWAVVSMEDQDFALMIALLFLKRSVKDVALTTVHQHPRWAGPWVWPILAVPSSDPPVGLCRRTVIWKYESLTWPSFSRVLGKTSKLWSSSPCMQPLRPILNKPHIFCK